MTDSGIFRNFIDDKFGIIDKPEREREKQNESFKIIWNETK